MNPQAAAAFTRSIAAALSVWFIVAFVYVALASLNYPFQLEWIEGQSMDTVQRVREGLPVYAEPSLDYVALLYTPLFYFVAAATSYLTGMDFIAGRVVSTSAALLSGLIIYGWVKKESFPNTRHSCASRNHFTSNDPDSCLRRNDKKKWHQTIDPSALCAAGLFFATYCLSGRWFDIARVDSLALCLTLSALYLLRFGHSTRGALLAGLLICAAFFTKQVAIVYLMPVASATILIRRRFGMLASLTAMAAILVCAAAYEHTSHGWFSFFTFKVPMGHRADHVKLTSFWENDLLKQQAFVLAACIPGLVHLWGSNRKSALLYTATLLCALAATWSSRLHMYGWVNNLIPLHATLALLAGLSLAVLWQPRPLWAAGTTGLILLQLVTLLYDPWPLIPKAKSIETGNAFLEQLSHYPGDAFLPDIQFIPPRSGHKTFSYGMGAYDVFRADLGPENAIKSKLSNELQTAIAQEKFSVIIPGRLIHYSLPMLLAHYRIDKELDYPEGYALDSQNKRRVTLYVPNHSNPETSNETDLHPAELEERPE